MPEETDSMSAPDAAPERGRLSNNLPLQLSSFVGREREMANVESLLAAHRLVTLTGPGGSGKTRLALAVASEAAQDFENGTYLVELASLADPDLISQAVASVLGVRESPGTPLVDSLHAHIGPREILLILDNCEHLIETCADLAETLLRSCPNLRILATSREALGVAGEILFTVPPLSLPDPRRLPAVGGLSHYEATRLFVERVRTVRPGFSLTEQNALAIAQICYRLDGIPLAIELAAARTKALSVEQIGARLDDSFALLTGGGRTAMPHHRTLRATMDWSHELLAEKEQELVRRLSVFAGGFALEAAEAVGEGEDIEVGEVLDLLASLVDKSLVLFEEQDDEMWYRLLETVRQYAQDKLEESGEAGDVRSRHAEFYMTLAEVAEPELKGYDQVAWLGRLEREHDNLRAAMRWLLDESEIESSVRLAWALWLFWYLHGHQGEGYRYTGELLDTTHSLPTLMRAKVLIVRGNMSYGQESAEGTKLLFEEAAALSRQTGDTVDLAIALAGVGVTVMQQGDMRRATTLFEEVLMLYREATNKWGVSYALVHLGMALLSTGDLARSTRYFEEALAISREIGYRLSGYISLYNLALSSRLRGDHEQAAEHFIEGLELAVEVGDKANTAYCLEGLAGASGASVRGGRAVARSRWSSPLCPGTGPRPLREVGRGFAFPPWREGFRSGVDGGTGDGAGAGRRVRP